MNIAILCNGRSDQVTDRVELIASLKQEGHNVFVAGINSGSIHSYYTKDNAEFISIEASRNNTNPFVEIKSIISVRKQMKHNRIDSTLIYGVKNHAAMAIGAKLGGVKNVVCVVNGRGNLFRISGIRGKILRFISFPMLTIAYMISNSVCFQNIDDLNLFRKKKIILNSKKTFCTGGSGVNLEAFPCSDLPSEDRFMFLARITASKGIVEYIKAAEIVKKKHPNAIFDIVGPLDNTVESDGDNFLNTAVENGIVDYHGATTNVSSWMSRCRYYIYPSYYPEGVPRCAMQALSTGRPIITCDTPGCRETVKEGINGFLIQPKDYLELASKMEWMIENPNYVEKMGKESRRFAVERFDVDKVNEELCSKLV